MGIKLYPGDRVIDTARGEVGTIVEINGRDITIKPLIGQQYTTDRRKVTAATKAQELAAKVRLYNAASRQRGQW